MSDTKRCGKAFLFDSDSGREQLLFPLNHIYIMDYSHIGCTQWRPQNCVMVWSVWIHETTLHPVMRSFLLSSESKSKLSPHSKCETNISKHVGAFCCRPVSCRGSVRVALQVCCVSSGSFLLLTDVKPTLALFFLLSLVDMQPGFLLLPFTLRKTWKKKLIHLIESIRRRAGDKTAGSVWKHRKHI